MYNHVNNVRGAVYARFRSETELAKRLGWSRAKVSSLISGVREPRAGDVAAMAQAMEMEPESLYALFLALLSQKCDS